MKPFLLFILSFFYFGAFAQIPNAGFESWNFFEADTMPDEWFISAFGAADTHESFSGEHAIVLWNWYYFVEGFAYTSANNTGLFSFPTGFIYDSGVPVSTRPVNLKGYYKYVYGNNDGNADSAVVAISLRKYNAELNIKDSVGYAELRLPPTDTYTAFTLPIHYYNELMPDTMVIALYSSVDGFCEIASDGNCLYFYVDDLTLETATGLLPVDDLFSANTYPVPANNILHISLENSKGISLQLYDAAGKLMATSFTTRQNEVLLNVSQLQSGIYFYSIENSDKESLSGRFVRQ